MMTIEWLKTFLLYNLAFNVSVATLWFLLVTYKRDWSYSLITGSPYKSMQVVIISDI